MQIGEAFVAVRPDTKGFSEQLGQDVESAGKDASLRLGQVVSAGLLTAGVAAATKGAAELEQAMGATETVFGEAQDSINEFADDAAQAMGLSERAFRDATAGIGALLTNMGYTNREAADWSVTLTQLGADMAAAFGGRPEDAVHALGRALVGEFDPLEQFNVSIRQQEINLKAVEMGLASSTSEVGKNERAQAALALIMEQTSAIQGQFARETETAAGAATIAAAEMENASDSLGENFLPVYQRISDLVGFVASGFGALPGPVQVGVTALAGAAVLSGPATTGVEMLRSSTAALKSGLDAAAGAAPRAWGSIQQFGATSAATVGKVAGLTAAIAALVIVAKEVRDATLEAADDKLSVSTDRLAQSMANSAEAGELLGGVRENIDGYAAAVEALDRSDFERFQQSWGRLNPALEAQRIAFDSARGDMELFDAQLMELQQRDPEAAAEFFTLFGDALVAQGYTWEQVGNAVPGYIAATQDAAEANREGVDDTEAATRATKSLAEQQEETRDKFNEATAAVRDAMSSIQEYFDRIHDGLDASLNWEESVDDLTASWIENQGVLDESTEAGRNNWRALQDVADAALAAGEQVLKMTKDEDQAKAKTLELADSLRTQLREQLGLSAEDTDYVIRALGLMPDQVETAYRLSGIDKALSDIQKVKLGLEGLGFGKNPLESFFGGARAEGGPVSPDRAYLVGEQGPEMFVPGTAGTIIPNTTGGVTFNQHNTFTGGRGDLERANRRALFALTTLAGG